MSAPPVAKKKTNYSVFIYSEVAPDAKYAIYKHTRKIRVLQYMLFGDFFYYDQIIGQSFNDVRFFV